MKSPIRPPETASAPPPDVEAIGAMLIEACQREANARAHLIMANRRIAELEARLGPPA